MFSVISINKKEEWEECLKNMKSLDFYHTWDFNHTTFKNGEGRPVLCIFKKGLEKIVFPIIVRPIVIAGYSDTSFDFTSVYGYAGPLSTTNVSNTFISDFSKAFKEYCKENKIISGFSRLHPLIEQETILKELGIVESNSKTVTIDLSQTLEQQRKHYRKSNKSEINQLRKKATIVWSTKSNEDIRSFINIYDSNMQRVNAKEYYFFREAYYHDFFNATKYDPQLLFVEIDGVKVAAAIFVFCDNIIQYHLAGTHEDYLRLAPIKLLLDEMRIYGKENGYNHLHLGGGTSQSEEDPLFKFKRGFSKTFLDFKIFKSIFDQDKYDMLAKIARQDSNNFNENFFPLYRNN